MQLAPPPLLRLQNCYPLFTNRPIHTNDGALTVLPPVRLRQGLVVVPEPTQVHERVGAIALHRHDAEIAAEVAGIGATDGQAVAQTGQRRGRVEVRRRRAEVHEALFSTQKRKGVRHLKKVGHSTSSEAEGRRDRGERKRTRWMAGSAVVKR